MLQDIEIALDDLKITLHSSKTLHNLTLTLKGMEGFALQPLIAQFPKRCGIDILPWEALCCPWLLSTYLVCNIKLIQ